MMYKLMFAGLMAVTLSSCTADGESVDSPPIPHGGGAVEVTSSGSEENSSTSADTSEVAKDSLGAYLKMVDIPAVSLARSAATFSVDAFSIGVTEVTWGVYSEVMGLEKDDQKDSLPVTEVDWYGAALFCNALSKAIGADTAYVYESVGTDGELVGLSINYEAASVRLPTETEWEVAVRGTTTSTYYWGTSVASKYAYYAQSKGPVKVAQYIPNEYGLYDMGGNVAEWVNDWYGAYPTTAKENYVGPENGDYRVVRGGGWSDKVVALASGERDKKIPLLASETVGFRIVYSAGF